MEKSKGKFGLAIGSYMKKNGNRNVVLLAIYLIVQTVVFGFAGVSVTDQTLHLQPALPDEWGRLSIRLFWHGCELNIQIDKCAVTVEVMNGVPVSLNVCGQELLLKDHGRIEYVH